MAEIKRKEPVVLGVKNVVPLFQYIEIGSRFAANNQIMFAYDFIFSSPIGKIRAAVLMDFTNQPISRIELFYDTILFKEKKDEIFEDQ